MKIDPRYKLWLLSEVERISKKRPFIEHIDVPVEKGHPIFVALNDLENLGYLRRGRHETRMKSPWGKDYIRVWYSWSLTDKGKEVLNLPESEALVLLKKEQQDSAPKRHWLFRDS